MQTLSPETIMGILYIVKELFMEYVSISGPVALLTMALGLLGTALGISMFFINPRREYITAFAIIAFLPLLLGIGGTVAWGNEIRESIVLEKAAGEEPTAGKYYDLEYAYSKFLISWFPAFVGIGSSFPPIILLFILKRRKMYDILSKEGGAG